MLILTKTQILLKNACKELGYQEIRPFIQNYNNSQLFPRIQIKKISQMGLMEFFNTNNSNMLSYLVALEEISKFSVSCGMIMHINNILYSKPILKYGTEKQKSIFLKSFANGKKIGCMFLALRNINMYYKEYRECFLLNGYIKTVINGNNSDIIIIFANSKNHKDDTLVFLVPIPYNNIYFIKQNTKLGPNPTSICDIIANNCKIPKEFLLGEKNTGKKIAEEILNDFELGLTSICLGFTQFSLMALIKHTKMKHINSNDNIRKILSNIFIKIEQARLLVWKIALLSNKNLYYQNDLLIPAANLSAHETAEFTINYTIQVLNDYRTHENIMLQKYLSDTYMLLTYKNIKNLQEIKIESEILKKYIL